MGICFCIPCWTDIYKTASFLVSDKVWLLAEQFLILMVGIYSLFQEGRGKSVDLQAEVTRGPESWQQFVFAWGILSVILIHIVSVSSAYREHKVLILMFDMSVALYLCFFSSWFRNKIIGLVNKAKTKKES